jgi:hypothetical protein
MRRFLVKLRAVVCSMHTMWLVMCSLDDQGGLWAYEGLRRRGLRPLELITAEVLGCALCWEHRLENRPGNGAVRTRFTLADARTFDVDEVRGTLNRLQRAPAHHLNSAATEDRDYSWQEFHAFFLSWLAGLPGVVLNPAQPAGLGGPWLHLSEWRWRAVQAGLPVLPYKHSVDAPPAMEDAVGLQHPLAERDAWVCGNRIVGDLPEALHAAALALARTVNCPLLQLGFDAQWRFVAANPEADLRNGGEPLLDAMFATLGGSEGEA